MPRSFPRRLLVLFASLSLLLAPAAPPLAQAQGEQTCFAETGLCISGRIREFWQQNGGLQVFGLPIAPQQQETIQGQALQVQWFERNRLELHPENTRPYDVLLGRLGADHLQQQGRDPFAAPPSAPQPGCRFFAETGRNVCGSVLAAWRASGLELDGQAGTNEAESLALFGLPLTDLSTETLADGRQYQVQWFERARFELHPENAPPFDVLLGLLGTETRAGASAPAPQMPSGLTQGTVVEVVDGDTVDVSIGGRVERLRLIGVDTPETRDPRTPVECYGREASARTQELLAGQAVGLEADPSQDDRDRYDRLLRYLWLPDGRMLNYELIAQGYAFEYTYDAAYRYQAQFKEAERLAREQGRGLWSPATCNGQRAPEAEAPTPAPTAPPSRPERPAPSYNNCQEDPNAAQAPNSPVRITAINKSAEVVTIQNVSGAAVSLDGWRICSIRGNQLHATLSGSLGPGESRAIESEAGGNIWNNSSRDDGALYDAEGRLVSYWFD